ncbi:MAG: response regulator [Fluviicola sp.]|jgi:two-component system response regulator DegU
MEKQWTVIVADDHPIFRKGVIEVLKSHTELIIVDELDNGLAAYQSILSKRPQIAILDLEMPNLTGLEVCEKVLSEKNDTKFILLTMHRDQTYFDKAMKIGIHGFVLKDYAVEEILKCINEIMKGKKYVSENIESFLQKSTSKTDSNIENLTSTEKIILKLITQEKSSQEIADLLFISVNTVDNHRSNMVKKLGLEGRNSLLKFALKLKI